MQEHYIHVDVNKNPFFQDSKTQLTKGFSLLVGNPSDKGKNNTELETDIRMSCTRTCDKLLLPLIPYQEREMQLRQTAHHASLLLLLIFLEPL